MISVYTDGSCANNGRKNAIGGIGIYFGPEDPRNYSESLSKFYTNTFKEIFGNTVKDTNNLAELCAILQACKILEKQLEDGEKILIITDSNYSINCLTKWFLNWKKNGWISSSKKPVSNKIVIEKILDDYLLKYKESIKFKHVKAHTSGTDADSIGNAAADSLARIV